MKYPCLGQQVFIIQAKRKNSMNVFKNQAIVNAYKFIPKTTDNNVLVMMKTNTIIIEI